MNLSVLLCDVDVASLMGCCRGDGNDVRPVPCKSPRPVCETSSAAPPIGLVTAPTRPFPTPETRPEACRTGERTLSASPVNVCNGWSAMPATAPKQG